MAAAGVLQAVGALLTGLGDSIQQGAATSAFYAKLNEITAVLEKNPGNGVIVEFVFSRVEPLPDSGRICPAIFSNPSTSTPRVRRREIHPWHIPGQARLPTSHPSPLDQTHVAAAPLSLKPGGLPKPVFRLS